MPRIDEQKNRYRISLEVELEARDEPEALAAWDNTMKNSGLHTPRVVLIGPDEKPIAKPDGIFFANDDYHRIGRALSEYIKMLDSEAITETDPDGIEWYKVEVEEVRELAARLNVDLED